MKKNIAVFLDRDGVLNRKAKEHDYIKSFEEFHWNSGAIKLVQQIKDRGLLAIVVSNQRGIARGKMSQEFVESLHAKMNEELEREGTHIDSFFFCPHSDGCECRKPKPGMFFKAQKEFGIDLEESLMLGDSRSDEEAAQAAGCKSTILIQSDNLDVEYIMGEIDRLLKI